jgi:hypothetical protein
MLGSYLLVFTRFRDGHISRFHYYIIFSLVSLCWDTQIGAVFPLMTDSICFNIAPLTELLSVMSCRNRRRDFDYEGNNTFSEV